MLVELESADNAGTIVGREELGIVGEVVYHPEGDETEDNSRDSLENEDPGPARPISNSVHLLDGSSQETSKGSRKSGSREENGL